MLTACKTTHSAVCHAAAAPKDRDFSSVTGLSNDCLVASSNELAVRYNDRSVLENHHCSTFTQWVFYRPFGNDPGLLAHLHPVQAALVTVLLHIPIQGTHKHTEILT